ncbi:hypothetical protein JK159_02245 [Weissella minor]|nr:hypothetical protein [Weissella minor]
MKNFILIGTVALNSVIFLSPSSPLLTNASAQTVTQTITSDKQSDEQKVFTEWHSQHGNHLCDQLVGALGSWYIKHDWEKKQIG